MASKWVKEQKLREKSIKELEDRVKELKSSLFTSRFQKSTGKLDNFQLLHRNKRRLATVLTILNEKKREQAQAAKAAEVKS